MEGTVRTQGTSLYLIDRFSSSTPDIVKFACPTGVTGMGGAKDQVESTCLDQTQDKTFVAGLGNPGEVSVPFNLIPSAFSHQTLFDLKESGETCSWLVCLSESDTAPTLDTSEEFNPPADRTSFAFQAYVADVNIDIAGNDIVRGTLTLQRSGPVLPNWFNG